jgi:membrane protein implicated in regulation of membrane protease activity
MTEVTIWWLLAGGAVVAELLTGTFFLLMISFGFAAAALAATAGANTATQIVVAAITGGGAVITWYLVKQSRQAGQLPHNDSNLNLDIGQTVMVSQWSPDGTARVKYRGVNWTVLNRSQGQPVSGAHRVVEVLGSRLVVEKIP